MPVNTTEQKVQVMELKLLDGVYELFEREVNKSTVMQSSLNTIEKTGKFNFIAHYEDVNERTKYFNEIKAVSEHLIKNTIRHLENALESHKELEYTSY